MQAAVTSTARAYTSTWLKTKSKVLEHLLALWAPIFLSSVLKTLKAEFLHASFCTFTGQTKQKTMNLANRGNKEKCCPPLLLQSLAKP